jgi:hypothetical protein
MGFNPYFRQHATMRRCSMRTFPLLTFAAWVLAIAPYGNTSLRADVVTGRVLCDADNNQVIDPGDIGLAGVTVGIRSQGGSFTNFTVTGPDGSFSLEIPVFNDLANRQDPLSQIYVETIVPGTLPAGATVLLPQSPFAGENPDYYIAPAAPGGVPLSFHSAAGDSTTGDWLIASASCQSTGQTNVPPPVPPTLQTNACALSGAGSILSSGRHAAHIFSGGVIPGTSRRPAPRGHWTHDARDQKLRFSSTAIDSIACGSDMNLKQILITGRGTLSSYGGKRTPRIAVLFILWVQDAGRTRTGHDLYYLRVYTADGATQLLVSSDSGNPNDIAPVPISRGNLMIRAVTTH